MKYEIVFWDHKVKAFSDGNAYLIQSKRNFDQKEFFFSKHAVYLNYPFDEAIKIVPFFECLKAEEKTRIAELIDYSYDFKTRIDDLFGRLLVALFYNIELHNLFIIGLDGLGDSSIESLIEILKNTVSKERSKVFLMTKISLSLREELLITTL